MDTVAIQKFQGKTALISGSSKGIGKVLARELGFMGAQVVLNGSNKTVLDATADELQALGIDVLAVVADVTKMDDCIMLANAALEKFGSIDMVFPNAGMSAEGAVEASDAFVFKRIMEVNFLGVVYLIKACLPALKRSGGKILITGSASAFRGIPGAAAYSASKMALTALAEALKIELCETGIYIGLAYVGFTENDPGKLMLDARGNAISKNNLARVHRDSQLYVAQQMIEMMQAGQFKKVFSSLGRLNNFVSRFAPWLSHFILKRHYLKTTAQTQIEPGLMIV